MLTTTPPRVARTAAPWCAPDETEAMALLSDWFAHMLLAPMDVGDVRQLRATGRHFVIALGQALHCETSVDALLDAVDHGTEEEIEVQLSRDYVQLFEGVAGPKSISLYESSYCGEGRGLFKRPFVEMQETLRVFDIRIDHPCCEPPDHLAIELAALAKAARLGQPAVLDGLIARLRGWTPSVAAAVRRSPHGSFYRHLFALIDAFLTLIASPQRPLDGDVSLNHEAHHDHR
jgi:TorA-specific chaperone